MVFCTEGEYKMHMEHCIFFLKIVYLPPLEFFFVMQLFLRTSLLCNPIVYIGRHLHDAISLENATLRDYKVAGMDSISSVTYRFRISRIYGNWHFMHQVIYPAWFRRTHAPMANMN